MSDQRLTTLRRQSAELTNAVAQTLGVLNRCAADGRIDLPAAEEILGRLKRAQRDASIEVERATDENDGPSDVGPIDDRPRGKPA